MVATPSKHWSKRTPFDTNKTLWASWHIEIDGFKTWFGGDTGYDQNIFSEIGQRFGPYDLALIPIGAYAPRYFMSPHHVNPEEAIKIHTDIRSNFSLGIHWGTFQLTHEPVLEPKHCLQQNMELNHSLKPFEVFDLGQIKVFTDIQ